MYTNKHMCRSQSIRNVWLVAYIYLLTIYMKKCVYYFFFFETLIFSVTTDKKKHNFSLKCVEEALIHVSLLAKHAMTINHLLLKKIYKIYIINIYNYLKQWCLKKILAIFIFRPWLSIFKLKGENIKITYKTSTSTRYNCLTR